MTYIDPNRASAAALEWHKHLETFLTDHDCKTKWTAKIQLSVVLTAAEKRLGVDLINDFCDHLDTYSQAMQVRMDKLRSYYDKNIKTHENLHSLVKTIFIYLYNAYTAEEIVIDGRTIKVSYYILNLLNVSTCLYCNRNYTFAVYGKHKRVRPQFDHFYDKASNPLLAVSFYNLIPSCPTCNHTKLNDSLDFNPYFYEFEGKFICNPDGTNVHLDSSCTEELEDMQTLGLDGLYLKHENYVKELIEKAHAYNQHARVALVTSFQGAGHSPDQVYNFVWGKNLEIAKHINRPLSKLTRDILEKLDIQIDDKL